jgi:hypothetical protein
MVDGGTNRARRTVNVLERRRDFLKKEHRSLGCQDHVATSQLSNLNYSLTNSSDRWLRTPAERAAPKPSRKLPAML